MTEGPTARLRAIQIEKEFLGKRLENINIRSKRVFVDPNELVGTRLRRAYTYGKNIF